MSVSPPDCLRCGACCFSTSARYVPVSGDDYTRLGDAAETLTVFHGNRCFMQMQDGHCAALEVTADGQFVCQVYTQRPGVCRTLERAGASCRAELSLKGASASAASVRVRLPLYSPA